VFSGPFIIQKTDGRTLIYQSGCKTFELWAALAVSSSAGQSTVWPSQVEAVLQRELFAPLRSGQSETRRRVVQAHNCTGFSVAWLLLLHSRQRHNRMLCTKSHHKFKMQSTPPSMFSSGLPHALSGTLPLITKHISLNIHSRTYFPSLKIFSTASACCCLQYQWTTARRELD
jgi:hypothetical protein